MVSEQKMQIAVAGATGRMGRVLLSTIANHAEFELSAALVSNTNPLLHTKVHTKNTDFETQSDIVYSTDIQKPTDVLIDFSTVGAFEANIELCLQSSTALVMCTTGLTNTQMHKLAQASKSIPIIHAPNTSIGINIILTMLGGIASILTNADVEIIDTHHKHKVDAPSGVAITLGQAIAAGRSQNFNENAIYNRHQQNEARKAQQIGFSSIRGGDVIGEHRVLFIDENEQLEIKHAVNNRQVFADGALFAAKKLSAFASGRLYTMQDIVSYMLQEYSQRVVVNNEANK